MFEAKQDLFRDLVLSGAITQDTPTDLLPDLGRKQKMMSSSCHTRMLCAQNGYAS